MYKVKLEYFEGPLDLLLFFLKRDELNIYDIPIAKITKDFLDYIHYMQMLDLEVAGEFIVMAATLMQIKVSMLLPREKGGEEEEDPRAELVRRLLDYRRYKELAGELSGLEGEARKLFYRQNFQVDPKLQLVEDDNSDLKDISLFHLISAFKHAMGRVPKKLYHEVERLTVTLDDQISYLMDFFRLRPEASFSELVAPMTEKIRMIVTFLAMLELIKEKSLGVRLDAKVDDFIVYRVSGERAAAIAHG